jgi:hypothetical protein
MYFWRQNSRMSRFFAVSPWRLSVFVLLLPIATRITAFQPPIRPPEQRNVDELKLTAVQEKDSYEIYSILLRTEMPPQWNITDWAIRQETQNYPNFGAKDGNNVNECLQLSPGQESI